MVNVTSVGRPWYHGSMALLLFIVFGNPSGQYKTLLCTKYSQYYQPSCTMYITMKVNQAKDLGFTQRERLCNQTNRKLSMRMNVTINHLRQQIPKDNTMTSSTLKNVHYYCLWLLYQSNILYTIAIPSIQVWVGPSSCKCQWLRRHTPRSEYINYTLHIPQKQKSLYK